MKIFPSKKYFIIVLILAFHISFLYGWLNRDNHLPQVDESVHLTYSLVVFSYLKKPLNKIYSHTNISSYYPPFYHISCALKYFFSDISFDSAVKINVFYLIILLFSTFFVAKKFFSEKLSLIAVLLLSFYPEIMHYSKLFFIDLALTSIFIFYLSLIFQPKFLKNTIFPLFSGFIFGLGMLTKWTFVFFALPPTIYFFYNFYKTKQKLYFKNIFIFGVAAFLMISVWYFPNFNKLIPNLIYGNKLGLTTGDVGFNNLNFYFYYFLKLPYLIGFSGTLLFFVSFLFFLKEKRDFQKNILLISITFSFIFLTLLFNKDPRFFLPLLPIIAIISVDLFTKIKRKGIKICLFFLIILFSLVNFCKTNFIYYPPKYLNYKPNEIIRKLFYLYKKDRLVFLKKNRPVFVGYFTTGENFNEYNFKYYLLNQFIQNNENLKNYNFYFIYIDKYQNKSPYYFILIKNNLTSVPLSLKIFLIKNFKLKEKVIINDNFFALIYKNLNLIKN